NYKPSRKTLINFFVGIANTDGYRADRLDTNKQPLEKDYLDSNVPYRTAGALIAHKLDSGLRLSLQYNYVDAYKSEGDGDDLENFESIDFKLSKEFLLSNDEKIEFNGIIRNVGDNTYQDFTDDNLVGLETYFQVKLSLN
ncbi:MAG: hypothetical protein P8Y20_12695, partial [Gammaproteobacteria bacterium]